MNRLFVGYAMPLGAILALLKRRVLCFPLPIAPYSKFGLPPSLANKITIFANKILRLPVATWGGRVEYLPTSLTDECLVFEDGFYRSSQSWKDQATPEKISYEHSIPYFKADTHSRLALYLRGVRNYSQCPNSKKAAVDMHIKQIRQGRAKYGMNEANAEQFIGTCKPVENVIALQTDGDYQVSTSPRFEALYPNFESLIEQSDSEQIRFHPLDERANTLSKIPTHLLKEVTKTRCITLFNSTLGLEAIVCGLAVTYYGESPILHLLGESNKNYVLPLTLLPTPNNAEQIVLAAYVLYPS